MMLTLCRLLSYLPRMKSVLLYTVHKAASSFLDQLLRQTCRRFGVPHFSENDDMFHDEIHRQTWAKFIPAQTAGPACFGPIRGNRQQPIFPSNLSDYSVILHLRDPRDVLTSLYYSYSYSHQVIEGRFEPEPGQRKRWQSAGIDEFVLNFATGYRANYEVLLERLLGRENVTVVLYEDMVTDYPRWLAEYLTAFEHLKIPRRKKRHLLLPQAIRRLTIRQQLTNKHRNAFQVDKEDPQSHKRRVTPGDYLNKLQPETREQLTEHFKEILGILHQHRFPQRKAA